MVGREITKLECILSDEISQQVDRWRSCYFRHNIAWPQWSF